MNHWRAHAAAIDAARLGDPGAIDIVIAAAWPHAFRIALSIVRHPMSAEDAAQEACARVVRSINTLHSAQSFGLWFYRLVVREALMLERGRRNHEPLDALDIPSASPLTDALVRIDVLHALGTLPPRERAVIALAYYAELKSHEIGSVLELPAGTVRYLLSCARKKLEIALDHHRPVPRSGDAVRAY
jgi:RNA polymerase sigma-70 factor (ECF subfamily)